jgi:alpha/beta superfamily hydrolase
LATRMERPATIALPEAPGREGDALEGLYRPGEAAEDGGAVIAPPHPLYGGSMDSPVVSELAFTLEKSGLASLRFNWRGVGASAGTASGEMSDACEDYCASLDFLEETVTPPLIAAGYSFGAATALASSDRPSVRKLILVAPPPSMLDLKRLSEFRGKVFIAVGDSDSLVSAERLEEIASNLAAAHFEVLPETDHFFMQGDGLAILVKALSGWLG